MSTEVLMPQMGESVDEATITRWLVKAGETVERDQPLLEVSTDKVDAEIPSPAAGTLKEIRVSEGETVAIDTVLAVIAGEGSVDGADEGETAAGVVQPGAFAAAALGERHDESIEPAGAVEPSEVVSFEERSRTLSSPLVRRIAAEEGVDLRQIEGTGTQGRITKRDVLAHLAEGQEPGPPVEAPITVPMPAPAPQPLSRASSPPPPGAEEPAQLTRGSRLAFEEASSGATEGPSASDFSVAAYTPGQRVEIEPMSKIRRLTAAHMLYSKQTSAHVTTVFDVDLSRIVAIRNQVKDAFANQHGTKLTFMPFFFQAVVAALRAHPKFNASIDGSNVVFKKDINLGMAVALDHGLIVPVIEHADLLSLAGLAQRANDLAERARKKRLKPEEVQGGTFTITNPGVYGSLFGTPVINQPQVAILCLGAIEKRPVVITDRNGNDALAIRSMAYLALSYDHRLIDGADAERFMVTVKAVLTEGEWRELGVYL